MLTCLRIRDDLHELCYPIRMVVDIEEVSNALDMSARHGLVAGLVLLKAVRLRWWTASPFWRWLEQQRYAPLPMIRLRPAVLFPMRMTRGTGRYWRHCWGRPGSGDCLGRRKCGA